MVRSCALKDGQQHVHPARVDERPGHERQERHPKTRGCTDSQLVQVSRPAPKTDPVTPGMVGGCARQEREDEPAETPVLNTNHLDRAPRLARERVQVAGEGDARQDLLVKKT